MIRRLGYEKITIEHNSFIDIFTTKVCPTRSKSNIIIESHSATWTELKASLFRPVGEIIYDTLFTIDDVGLGQCVLSSLSNKFTLKHYHITKKISGGNMYVCISPLAPEHMSVMRDTGQNEIHTYKDEDRLKVKTKVERIYPTVVEYELDVPVHNTSYRKSAPIRLKIKYRLRRYKNGNLLPERQTTSKNHWSKAILPEFKKISMVDWRADIQRAETGETVKGFEQIKEADTVWKIVNKNPEITSEIQDEIDLTTLSESLKDTDSYRDTYYYTSFVISAYDKKRHSYL